MVFISDVRMIAHCWLRPGNSHTANNASAFLDNTLENFGGKRIALLRADNGFCDQAFLQKLEQKELHHVIALRLNQPLQRALVESPGWWM
ncbi:MAG: transposase [Acidiferrobacter sp.]